MALPKTQYRLTWVLNTGGRRIFFFWRVCRVGAKMENERGQGVGRTAIEERGELGASVNHAACARRGGGDEK